MYSGEMYFHFMGFIYYKNIIYANNVMKYKFPKDIQIFLEFHSMPNVWLRDTHKLRWHDFEDFFPPPHFDKFST